MANDPQSDLEMIADQLRQILAEQYDMRAAMAVLWADVMRRFDGLDTIVEDIRATLPQHD